MAKHTLTLDIKANGIDWVLLSAGFRKVRIEKSGHLVCRPDEEDSAKAVATLKDLRDALENPGGTCIASIEGRGLFARSVSLPFKDRRKVRQILPLELEATLPVAIDELTVDFQMAGNGSGSTALSVAMARERVDFYVHLLREAGLDPTLITFSGLPAAMLLAAGSQGEQTSLLIDGDGDHGIFFVVGKHRLQFLRSWTPPETEDEPPAQALKHVIVQTLEAVSQVTPDHSNIRQVYLTSRGARHYAPEQLAAALDLEVGIFDVAQSTRMPLDGDLKGGHGQGALALGLYAPMVEKGLNLFRPTFPLKRFLQQHRKQFIRTGAVAALLIIIFLADVVMDMRRNEAIADALKKRAEAILTQTFPETRNIVNPLQQMIVKVREIRNAGLISPQGAQSKKIDILNTISQSLPPRLDIHVSQLVASMERVQISGTTGAFEEVNEAKENLEKSGIFDTITIISANMDQKSGRVRFKLSADIAEKPRE